MVDKKHKLPSDEKRKRMVKSKEKTNTNYGKNPNEQSVKELLNNGIINLDKPLGPTSHQIDAWIKKIFNTERIGHGGTLDPNATGVLPIGMGDATKALQFLLPGGKEYIGIMKLHKDIENKKIIETCKDFVGIITQLPPIRSAVKRIRRKRRIYYLDVIEIQKRDVLFRVGCESGTYIRTLCVDIGKKLRCGAHLDMLRRSRVAHLHEKESFLLQDVKDAFIFWKEEKNEEYIRRIVLPIERLFEHLPKIIIKDSAVGAICNGASLAIPGVAEIDSDIKKDELCAVFTLKNEVVAIVKTLMNTDEIMKKETGICANIERVTMKKGTYPPIWKKH